MSAVLRAFAHLGVLPLLASVVVVVGAAPSVSAADGPVPGPPVRTAVGVRTGIGAPPLPGGLTAASFLVADLDTGAILAARDARHRLLPASTLKVLTALALIPRIPKTAVVVPTVDDVRVDGTRVGIVENMHYPAYQLFRAMLMASGNDAANAVARAAGGQGQAVRWMNDQARSVGANDTLAINPSGLDAPGQVTTAYDLALIARAAMRLPDFRAYVATKHSSINGRGGHALPISSHDKLLYNYPGAIGIKNGYTSKAGATFIGAARRGGVTLLVTVLHAAPRVWPEVGHLLDWGFAAETAGAAPVGRLVDRPVRALRPQAHMPATVQGVVPARRRASPGAGSSGLPVAAGAGLLVAGLLVRRRYARPRPGKRRRRRS